MSILIKGMEMPKNCDHCWALDEDGDYPRCRITDEQRGYNFPVREQRMGKCPLVPVPEHGRLIDADEFFASLSMDDKTTIVEAMHINELLVAAPTIIPADHIGDANEMVADMEGEG